jgi:hypothetical protein
MPTYAKLPFMTNAPTTEQQAAIDAFVAGKTLVIEAGAGTGKTTTLRSMAEATPDRMGVYLAYNKAIQTDAAGSFPANVDCRTAHSLAYGWMMGQPNGKQIMNKLRTNSRVPSWTAAKILGIPYSGFNGSEAGLSQNACASAVMIAVSRFCNSADAEPSAKHVEKLFEGDDQAQLAAFIAPFARKAWKDITSTSGNLRFVHDHYLKMWSLACPKLKGDFVLFDEAQDANPCIAAVVQGQAHMQVVMVGDRSQAIYGWRGAVDAMSKFDADVRLVISQSFRFGPAIAAEANKFLDLLDAPLRLSGFDKIDSTVIAMDEVDAILCRTNATVIAEAMSAQSDGRTVAIVGGTKEIERFTKAADKLMSSGKTEHEDLISFTSWSDVIAYANEADGKDLKVMVNLIENYGVDAVLAVCSASVNEDSADIIVSTAHKAKGREWSRVRLANDFRAPQEGEAPRKDELMLLYVSVTRAQISLDCTAVSWINEVVAV